MKYLMSAILAGAFALSGPVYADDAPAFKKFTFKRVKVGSSAGKRITVQIDPAEQARALAVTPKAKSKEDGGTEVAAVAPSKPTSASYDWYWSSVSPKLHDAGPGRLNAALKALGAGPDGKTVRSPAKNTMQQIAKDHGTEILKATIGTNVSPAFALAVIGVESGGRTTAVSSAGATGVMQLMPATAKRFGVSDVTNASQNIKGGVAYLDWLLKEFERDPILALAGYNAGEGAVKEHGGVPPYAETRDYVPKVLAAWQIARSLCKTPPQFVSDGCVFSLSGGQ